MDIKNQCSIVLDGWFRGEPTTTTIGKLQNLLVVCTNDNDKLYLIEKIDDLSKYIKK